MTQEQLKERLKQTIINSRLSHRSLESITGISRTTIYRYANKQIDKIPFSAIEKIANATNTDIKWLMGWDNDETCEDKTLIKKLYSLVKTMSDNDIEKIIEYAMFINSKKL